MQQQILRKVVQGFRPSRPTLPHKKPMTDAMWSFVNACWHQDPVRRPTSSQLVFRLRAATFRYEDANAVGPTDLLSLIDLTEIREWSTSLIGSDSRRAKSYGKASDLSLTPVTRSTKVPLHPHHRSHHDSSPISRSHRSVAESRSPEFTSATITQKLVPVRQETEEWFSPHVVYGHWLRIKQNHVSDVISAGHAAQRRREQHTGATRFRSSCKSYYIFGK